jgi:hypothetical protein
MYALFSVTGHLDCSTLKEASAGYDTHSLFFFEKRDIAMTDNPEELVLSKVKACRVFNQKFQHHRTRIYRASSIVLVAAAVTLLFVDSLGFIVVFANDSILQ